MLLHQELRLDIDIALRARYFKPSASTSAFESSRCPPSTGLLPSFDSLKLTMLGVKSTCKGRWRQVLAEADRIDDKHLLTLETAISTNQTNEMAAKRLQLILPRSLHQTYTPPQQAWLMDAEAFIGLARQRQGTTTHFCA